MYEAGIVHLTLRQIFQMADDARGEVAYVLDVGSDLTEKSIEILKQRITQIVVGLKATKPLFFLSFLEPPQTTRGFFYNNRHSSIYRVVRDMNDSMSTHLNPDGLSGLNKTNACYFVETNDIVTYFGNGESSDSYNAYFAHAGVFHTEEADKFYLTCLQRILNALYTMKGNDTIKLIITDLDNTLWIGVAAEEDQIVPWLHYEGWPIGYVEALLECKRRGILLAICSKNDDETTRENFKKIWGEKIKIDDFCSVKINQLPKSENVLSILTETNLLPDNVLFIDDNSLEIDDINRAFPKIRTLTYPPEKWRNILIHSPSMQVVHVTEEASIKTELIKAKIERDSLSHDMNHDEWLQSLNLNLIFDEICNTQHLRYRRAYELLNKTNQFNTTGRRWSDEEIHLFFMDGGIMLGASAQDRLANHGLISLALLKGNEIVQIVLSCRIFGLGIEIALLKMVMDKLLVRHSSDHALFSDSGRNAICRDFYAKQGFLETSPGIWVGN